MSERSEMEKRLATEDAYQRGYAAGLEAGRAEALKSVLGLLKRVTWRHVP